MIVEEIRAKFVDADNRQLEVDEGGGKIRFATSPRSWAALDVADVAALHGLLGRFLAKQENGEAA